MIARCYSGPFAVARRASFLQDGHSEFRDSWQTGLPPHATTTVTTNVTARSYSNMWRWVRLHGWVRQRSFLTELYDGGELLHA